MNVEILHSPKVMPAMLAELSAFLAAAAAADDDDDDDAADDDCDVVDDDAAADDAAGGCGHRSEDGQCAYDDVGDDDGDDDDDEDEDDDDDDDDDDGDDSNHRPRLTCSQIESCHPCILSLQSTGGCRQLSCGRFHSTAVTACGRLSLFLE